MVRQTLNVVYQLEDGTGQIEGRFWIDGGTNQDDGNTDEDEIMYAIGLRSNSPIHSLTRLVLCSDNSYVRIMGSVKDFQHKRHLNVQRISPIRDHHEIFFHMLEALHVHLEIVKTNRVSTPV